MLTTPSAMKSVLAYEKIRDLIITGVKLPGTRLVIADLEAELHLGRGAIREALMRLDRSGLVHNMPYRGMVVAAPPTMEEIEYIYSMRGGLEVMLAVEGMKRITEEDILELESFLEQSARADGLESTFFSLDRKFHARIYRASGMTRLCGIVDTFMDTIEVYLNLYSYEDATQAELTGEHREILRCLKERDAVSLERVMRSNIMGGLALVKNAYKKIIHKEATR